MQGQLRAGQRLGNYRIISELGRGGMATVYLAEDLSLRREVALKLLSAPLRPDPDAKARLLREAQLAASLDHPNIGTVYTVESGEGGLYIVMARYVGETLRETLERAALPFDRALDIAMQTLRGLAYAHEAGIIHRDIKPANLFVTEGGVVKLLDFGLARPAEARMTAPGMVVGTIVYSPPEVLRGEAGDKRADFWAWGVVFYECLTGTLPFGDDRSLNVMDGILGRDPDPLSLHLPPRPEVTRLEALFARLLDKDPAQRPASAAEIFSMLEPLLGAPARGAQRQGVPNNLPLRLKPFVARPEEEAALERLADPDCALVTLTGQGGSGKTHLALRVAQRAIETALFPDGVYFVALESLSDAEALPNALAEALSLPQHPQPWRGLQEGLGERQLLLVLDSFEHLMEASPALEDLLTHSRVKLLVTSRERLTLPQECSLTLGGLAYPTEGKGVSDSPAAQVFLEAARRQTRDYRLPPDAEEDLGTLLELLQGWPLGLELAGSWTAHLSLPEIIAELRGKLDLPQPTSRSLPERHRSLRAVFASSWQLLNPEEGATLRTLAVFHGGFSREAAEALGVSLPTLAALLDKSLLRQEGGRYTQHPLLWHYSLEHAKSDPAAYDAARAAHAHYYSHLLETLSEGGRLSDAQSESSNLRGAWTWALETADLACLEGLSGGLYRLEALRGGGGKVRALFREAVAVLAKHPGTAPLRAQLLGYNALLCDLGGMVSEGLEEAQASLALAKGCEGLLALAGLYNALGRYSEAATSARAARSAGGGGEAERRLAQAERLQGEYARARVRLERLLKTLPPDSPLEAAVRLEQGETLRLYGETDAAQDTLRLAYEAAQQQGDTRLMPEILGALARLAWVREETLWARRLLLSALRAAQGLGVRETKGRLLLLLAEVEASLGYPSADTTLTRALVTLKSSETLPVRLEALLTVAGHWQRRDQAHPAALLLAYLARDPHLPHALRSPVDQQFETLRKRLGSPRLERLERRAEGLTLVKLERSVRQRLRESLREGLAQA